MEAETETVRAFVLPERRTRWLDALAHPRRRRKVLHRLAHDYDWIDKYVVATSLSGHKDERADALAVELRRLGAPDACHVVALHEMDGQSVPLTVALDTFLDWGDALLICVPGALALHLPEAPEPPIILHKARRPEDKV